MLPHLSALHSFLLPKDCNKNPGIEYRLTGFFFEYFEDPCLALSTVSWLTLFRTESLRIKNNISLYGNSTFYLSCHHLMDFWVVFIFSFGYYE